MTSELNIVISIIITIVFGYFFYYKSKISKSLVLHYSASVVQEKYHPEIILQYQKNSINKLCKLIVVIFNGGNTEIRASDFPKGKIPQINFATGLKLLSYKILDKSNESSKLDVNQLKQGALSTKFDYLNPKDGFILEILYDATDEIKKPLKFSAPLIGGKIRIFNSESNSIKYLLIVYPLMIIEALQKPVGSTPSVRKQIEETWSSRPEWMSILEYSIIGFTFLICTGIYFWVSNQSKIPRFAKKYLRNKNT